MSAAISIWIMQCGCASRRGYRGAGEWVVAGKAGTGTA